MGHHNVENNNYTHKANFNKNLLIRHFGNFWHSKEKARIQKHNYSFVSDDSNFI